MRFRPFRRRRRFLPLAVATILAFAVYGFTASNTVPATNAGAGGQAISGYSIANVAYNLNSTNPQNLDSVTFTISPSSATVVKASVNGTSWYGCTNSSGSVSCATTSPQATASGATSLQVVATG
jgi:hypothetical protein